MIRFYCPCGAEVFFESRICQSCNRALAFNPSTVSFEVLPQQAALTEPGADKTLCQNGIDYGVCNWLAHKDAPGGLCSGCQYNRTIPNLSRTENVKRWDVIEAGKKRLLYGLLRLGIPITSGWQLPGKGLLFDFLEDQRSNPEAEASFITTGFLDGIITLNVLEADPALRFVEQQAANEVYRTVLGHLRHESGHYVYSLFAEDHCLQQSFATLFGDSSENYNQALKRFYANGATPDWDRNYITPYASSHPLEDWAETWGHYLHLHDTLETAVSFKLIPTPLRDQTFDERIQSWRDLSVGFNELNRSMGLNDAYPFVINEKVAEKLQFANAVTDAVKTQNLESAVAPPHS